LGTHSVLFSSSTTGGHVGMTGLPLLGARFFVGDGAPPAAAAAVAAGFFLAAGTAPRSEGAAAEGAAGAAR
jgi:hypothetical protein